MPHTHTHTLGDKTTKTYFKKTVYFILKCFYTQYDNVLAQYLQWSGARLLFVHKKKIQCLSTEKEKEKETTPHL